MYISSWYQLWVSPITDNRNPLLVVTVATSPFWQWCNFICIQSCSDDVKTCQVQFISVYNVARLARSRIASGHHICHLPEVKVSLSSLTTDHRWNWYEEIKITDMNKHGETSFWHQALYIYIFVCHLKILNSRLSDSLGLFRNTQ